MPNPSFPETDNDTSLVAVDLALNGDTLIGDEAPDGFYQPDELVTRHYDPSKFEIPDEAAMGELDEEEAAAVGKAAAESEASKPARRARAAAPGGSDDLPKTIYDAMVKFGLLRKVTDIVMAKVSVPWNLREEAEQEVHVYWASLPVQNDRARNQIANYAYISGKHAALKLRRTMGAVCAIPSACFRSGRDSAFMNAIGAAVNPWDIDDYADSAELSTSPQESGLDDLVSEQFFNQRTMHLGLTYKQRKVAYLILVARLPAQEVASILSCELQLVDRLVNQVVNKLNQSQTTLADAADVAKKASKVLDRIAPAVQPKAPTPATEVVVAPAPASSEKAVKPLKKPVAKTVTRKNGATFNPGKLRPRIRNNPQA